jgi:excisionase family DNA binding protein
MPPRTSNEGALYVRLPAKAVAKLDRAAERLGVHKKDLIAGLLAKYVDPDSKVGLDALGTLTPHRVTVEVGDTGPTVGAYSFRSYEAPEVLTAAQAGELLQLDESAIVKLAEAGELPGKKLGAVWRFSRTALVAYLT